MSKEEIEEELTILSEQDDDWEKIRCAFNLGLRIAADKAIINLYTKGLYKGAKWKILKEGDTYNPLEKSLMGKLDKQSILKYKL